MLKKHFLFSFFPACFFLFLIVCRPSGLYFLCDDFAHVPEAANLNLFQTHLLRPVANLSLWLDNKLWGFDAEGYHATNLVLHLLNCVLLFFLAKKLQKRYHQSISQGKELPLFAATLFLCYFFHSEPVFWIVGRGGSLCTLFLQASLLLFFNGKKIGYLLSLVCFAVALFTYELSWTFPLLLTTVLLYDRWALKKRNSVGIIAGYWTVLITYLWYRFGLLHYPLPYGTANEVSGNPFGILRNICALMARLFVPPLQSSLLFLLFALFAVATISVFFYRVTKGPTQKLSSHLFLGSCCLVAILPVAPLGIDTHDSESERFIYFASVFACLFVVFLLSAAIRRRQILALVLSFIILLNLYGLYRSSQAYRYASNVSKQLVETLNKLPNVKRINFINLPTQYKGALLFRIGFVVNKAGILGKKYDSINVISYQELMAATPFTINDEYSTFGKEELKVEYRDSILLLR